MLFARNPVLAPVGLFALARTGGDVPADARRPADGVGPRAPLHSLPGAAKGARTWLWVGAAVAIVLSVVIGAVVLRRRKASEHPSEMGTFPL